MAVSSIHNGWRYDPANSKLNFYYRGTLVGSIAAAGLGLEDNLSLELGDGDDSVLRHRTGTLAANTALTDVLIGTPVAAALAADSTILSNVTASGDVAAYVNTWSNSEQFLFADGSAKNIAFGQTGWAANLIEGAVKLTLGTVAAFATTQPTNALVFQGGTAPAGTIATSSAIYASTTVLNKIIADGTISTIQT